jgi:hypothetical protein
MGKERVDVNVLPYSFHHQMLVPKSLAVLRRLEKEDR